MASADQVWAAGVRLRGSASLQDAACANGKPLPSSPQWLGKVLLSTPLPWVGLRLGVEWLYGGDRKGLGWTMSVLNLFDMRDPQLAAAANGPSALEQDHRRVQLRLAYF